MTKKTLNELRANFRIVATIEIETIKRAEEKEEEERASHLEYWLPEVYKALAGMILLASGCGIITEREFNFINEHLRYCKTYRELKMVLDIID